MATQWMAAPWYKPQRWLLEDGSVVETPAIEASSSGRRVRIVGTTNSVGNRQIQTLLDTAIDNIAQERGTKRLMRVFDETAYLQRVQSELTNGNSLDVVPSLHLLEEAEAPRKHGNTTIWWRFQVEGYPQLPVFAFARLSTYLDRHTVVSGVVYPITYPDDLAQAEMPVLAMWTGSDWKVTDRLYFYESTHRALRDKVSGILAAEGVNWGEVSYGSAKPAVIAFANICRSLNMLDEVKVPNFLDKTGDNWFTCKATALTNYTGAFAESLSNFMQTGPILDRLKETMGALMRDLNMLGYVSKKEVDDNALLRLVEGDPSGLKIQLKVDDLTTLADGREVPCEDNSHELLLDLAHGVVILSCDHNQDMSEVAQAWNVAKFQAELTGEADVLMEYARAYKLPREQKRLEKILTSRTIESEETSTP